MKKIPTMQPAKEICPTTTKDKVENGALMLDVREQSEVDAVRFDVSHYLHIPLSVFEAKMQEVPKDKEIVVVCKSGSRSLRVTYFLMNHGYENVFNMKNGIKKWIAKGFPTIGDTSSFTSDACDSDGCC